MDVCDTEPHLHIKGCAAEGEQKVSMQAAQVKLDLLSHLAVYAGWRRTKQSAKQPNRPCGSAGKMCQVAGCSLLQLRMPCSSRMVMMLLHECLATDTSGT